MKRARCIETDEEREADDATREEILVHVVPSSPNSVFPGDMVVSLVRRVPSVSSLCSVAGDDDGASSQA